MNSCAWLLIATLTQMACVSTNHRAPTTSRTVASEPSKFDGAYSLVAMRCAVEWDVTQVKADVFALRQAVKARGVHEVETGHSKLVSFEGSRFSLNIDGPKFTYVTQADCAMTNSGEVQVRGDGAVLHRTGLESCRGEKLAVTSTPELEISQVSFVDQYLVESSPSRCTDGRSLQRIWVPAQSF